MGTARYDLRVEYRIPTVNLREYVPTDEALSAVPSEVCRRLAVIPIARHGRSLILATSEPWRAPELRAEIEDPTTTVELVLAPREEILSAIDRCYGAPC